MDEQLVALYHQHVAASFDRQTRLSDFLEREAQGADWHYQVSTATLAFGSTVKFQAHDLGSHAEADNSWMWVWCNPHMKLTPANHDLSVAVRALGSRYGIEAFAATSYFDVGPVLGEDLSGVADHVFGIVVSGELGYNAYYTMPYENGRFTALLRDERLRSDEPHPLARVASVFPQVVASYPVLDQRAALLGYLEWYGYEPLQEAHAIRLVENGTEVLHAEFDDMSRMTNLTAHLRPHS
ncbi:Uncharacterized protein OS=Rhodopirellula sp. SWK7 GN=RRSWK_03814 PE=4 SV=1 [Gemmataceae bacterium]|nr:Uncharacterized protein OS=Rhodopirellula sp. SWK7 GN=RRSWK_03814 PE=4 SV=1 [Gemmataceae bacterium]VTU00535.1 Uncharacterized protein OS=Rhodopirellula sp. SWK7 GN=RRSWK_03814 PE=4 SV=1 [Gemmataceae bacterium]